MPFCTMCGANVTGAFCNQCGTPAAASASGPAAPPPGPFGQAGAAPPPPQPMPYGQPVAARKTSPLVWILVIVVGLFVLGGLATVGVVAFVAHKARQAGIVDISRDGGISIQGRGSDGKNARIEFGTSVGKLPSWVPVYPGSDPKATFSVKASGDDGGEGGNYSFTTSDSAGQVRSFYQGKFKDLGLKSNLETSSDEGGMLVGAEDGGDRRSLTIVIAGGQAGETTVNITYGAKRN